MQRQGRLSSTDSASDCKSLTGRSNVGDHEEVKLGSSILLVHV